VAICTLENYEVAVSTRWNFTPRDPLARARDDVRRAKTRIDGVRCVEPFSYCLGADDLESELKLHVGVETDADLMRPGCLDRIM
jgi:hypothetical protein